VSLTSSGFLTLKCKNSKSSTCNYINLYISVDPLFISLFFVRHTVLRQQQDCIWALFVAYFALLGFFGALSSIPPEHIINIVLKDSSLKK